jgi:hypothetical protein
VGQQRDASWLPKEQQSSILKVSVLEQHPHYAMTALALGDQHLWVNKIDKRRSPRCVFAFRPRTFRWCCNRRCKPVFVIFCAPKWRSVLMITDRWK